MKIPLLSKIPQKGKKNLLSGILYQTISISMGLILPYLFITNLGSESNGLLSSVSQVFICLGLLEAGVGTATLQALYKPLADNDYSKINGILSATNRYYRKTGFWYAIAVTILTAVYPFFVDSELPSLTIRLVILLQGIGAVITYLFQSKYNLLLRAEGKSYVLTNLSIVILLLRNFGKIIAISLGYNVVAVQTVQLITIVIEAVFIISYVRHKYPWLSVKETPDYKAISQKNSVLIQSIAWMVFNHTDILVLTVFTRDLKLVSVYSVYSLIFEAAQNVLNQITGSFQYQIGYLAQKSNAELDSYFKGYSLRAVMLLLSVFTSVYLISTPFIQLYTANIEDVNYLIAWVPELFFIYKMLYGLRSLNKQVIEAVGHFKKTERFAIVEAITNIIISIALVALFGIVGVLIGTLIALIVSDTLYFKYLSRYILKTAIKTELKLLAVSIPLIIASLFIGVNNLLSAGGWLELVLVAVLICVISLVAYECVFLIIKKMGLRR